MYFLREDKTSISIYVSTNYGFRGALLIHITAIQTKRKNVRAALEKIQCKFRGGNGIFIQNRSYNIQYTSGEKFSEKWAVYSLNEFNIKEMMIHNQRVKK